LTDPTVSQFHAELVAAPGGGGVAVTDLGSRNGTRVGALLVRGAVVPSGTELLVGATRVRVELATAPSSAAAATAPAEPIESFGGLVGGSAVMRETYATLARLARTELSVLLEGQTGTGKDLAARALHAASPRAAGPFVALDCTAIPGTLAESLL